MSHQFFDITAELIQQHDCVIIPGFGGFVARKSPSYISPGNNTIYPASKSILFNSNLKNNDGLLANHLILNQHLSYAEANVLIGNFVSEISNILIRNQRLEFGLLGTIYLDKERNILFDANLGFNFLSDSFGLPPLALRKVEDENSSDKQFKTDRTLTTDRNKSRLNFGTVKKTALVGSLCLILGFMLAISLAPNNSFLAGLNPFVSNPERKYLSNPNKPLIQNQEEEEDINKITLNQNGTGTLDLNGNEKIVFVYVNTTTNDNNQALKNEILSRNNPYNPPIESKKFEVVIGCFRDKGNAERMKRNAASFNLPSRVIGKNEKDLFVVSAGGFSDINSTIPCLEKAKSQFPDAWVLKK